MNPINWLKSVLKSSYPSQDDVGLRKLERVANRIDQRTDNVASAIRAISEHLQA